MKRWVWLSHQTCSTTVLCLCAQGTKPFITALNSAPVPASQNRLMHHTNTLCSHFIWLQYYKKGAKTKIPLFAYWPFGKITKALGHLLLCCSTDLRDLPQQFSFYFNKSWLRKVNPSASTVMSDGFPISSSVASPPSWPFSIRSVCRNHQIAIKHIHLLHLAALAPSVISYLASLSLPLISTRHIIGSFSASLQASHQITISISPVTHDWAPPVESAFNLPRSLRAGMSNSHRCSVTEEESFWRTLRCFLTLKIMFVTLEACGAALHDPESGKTFTLVFATSGKTLHCFGPSTCLEGGKLRRADNPVDLQTPDTDTPNCTVIPLFTAYHLKGLPFQKTDAQQSLLIVRRGCKRRWS